MRYVGIDSAYRHSGVVVMDGSGVVLARQHLKNPEEVDHLGWIWWEAEATKWIGPGDVVAIEGLSFGSVNRSHNLAITFGLWVLQAVAVGSHVFVVPPTRVKRWATGSGVAKKPQMISWARQYLALAGEPPGKKPPKLSEHEADALVLATLAREAHARLDRGPTDPQWSPLPSHRQDILWNALGNGVLQTPGQSSLQGHHGKEARWQSHPR